LESAGALRKDLPSAASILPGVVLVSSLSTGNVTVPSDRAVISKSPTILR